MVLLAVILCGTIAVRVVAPLVASRFIDRAVSAGTLEELIFLALMTIGLALAEQVTDEASAGRVAVLGALRLYLDFINLFIYLLRIFGTRRN